MMHSVRTRSARTLLALTAATTVGVTGLAGPAQAHDDYDYDEDEVKVKICKVVEHEDDYEDDYDDDYGHKHARFTFKYKADGHKGHLKLKADHCKKVYVHKYSTFKLWEYETDDYELDEYKVYGAKHYYEKDNHVVVKVHKKDIKITVVNVHEHDDDDDDDDDKYKAAV